MKKPFKNPQYINLIANPLVLAIPVSIFIIFLFLPKTNNKYKVTLSQKEIANKKNSSTQFYDLDNDGNDELITSFHNNTKSMAAIKIITADGINYEQWNFNGYYSSVLGSFSCQDLNKDGFGEIYAIYYRADSVFFTGIQPYPNRKWIFKELFITKVWKRNKTIDYLTDFSDAADFNGDGIDELIFEIKAGFSRQPRSIYIFNPVNKEVISSPSVGAMIGQALIADLNKDDIPELYVGSSTPKNIPDTMSILLHDQSSWLMGYDQDLQWLFPPIENPFYPSGVEHIACVTDQDQNKYILWGIWNKEQNGDILKVYNSKGEMIKSFHPIQNFHNQYLSATINFDDRTYYLAGSDQSDFIFIDQELNLQRIPKLVNENIFLKKVDDIDKNGDLEYIFQTSNYDYIIYDKNLENPIKLETGILPHTTNYVFDGVKHHKDKAHQFFYKTDQYLYLYYYAFDPNYYLKYAYWILTYILITALFWFAQYAQRIQSRKKQKIEDTINALQMKTLKSQMDPHFMFNVLNGIGAKVRKGDKIESYDHIVRFSQLLRSLMKKVDRLEVSLEEELSFVKTYLELERFRFEENFAFEIEVDKQADLNTKIPRMLIQLLVENSIKHGLSPKPDLKTIHISVHKLADRVEVKIKDNGIGRQAAQEKTTDSGQGLKIIHQMIELYRKTTGSLIELHYEDLKSEDGTALGTLAVVGIL
jgi:hypothetical protein